MESEQTLSRLNDQSSIQSQESSNATVHIPSTSQSELECKLPEQKLNQDLYEDLAREIGIVNVPSPSATASDVFQQNPQEVAVVSSDETQPFVNDPAGKADGKDDAQHSKNKLIETSEMSNNQATIESTAECLGNITDNVDVIDAIVGKCNANASSSQPTSSTSPFSSLAASMEQQAQDDNDNLYEEDWDSGTISRNSELVHFDDDFDLDHVDSERNSADNIQLQHMDFDHIDSGRNSELIDFDVIEAFAVTRKDQHDMMTMNDDT